MIRHWHSYVAGVTFEGRQAAVRRCKVGEELLAAHERANRFSRHAVILTRRGGATVGYLPDAIGKEYVTKVAKGIRTTVVVSRLMEPSEDYPGRGLAVALVESDGGEDDAAIRAYINTRVEFEREPDCEPNPIEGLINVEESSGLRRGKAKRPWSLSGCVQILGLLVVIGFCAAAIERMRADRGGPERPPAVATPRPSPARAVAPRVVEVIEPAPPPPPEPDPPAAAIDERPPATDPATESIADRAKRERQRTIELKRGSKSNLRKSSSR